MERGEEAGLAGQQALAQLETRGETGKQRVAAPDIMVARRKAVARLQWRGLRTEVCRAT